MGIKVGHYFLIKTETFSSYVTTCTEKNEIPGLSSVGSVTAPCAENPGFDSCHLHKCRDWWHGPITLLLGDKDMEWLEEYSLDNLISEMILH